MFTVDVVLISYNQFGFIRQAIESIFMQRIDAKVRLIVADDGSTDGTLDLIKELAKDSPFEVVFLPEVGNLGISNNYLRAFNACNGDYIAILEGDDYWCSPFHLEQHVRFLDAHRECSMSMNSYIVHNDSTGEMTPAEWFYRDNPHYVNIREQIAEGNQLGNLSACVLRTSCVKKLPVELFNIPVADWMLGVMLAQQGFLAILKEPTTVYRTNANSQWAAKSQEEQVNLMIKRAEEYDAFQDGKFHDYWQVFKNDLLKERPSYSTKDWFPPFMVSLLRACTPPALKKKGKRNG